MNPAKMIILHSLHQARLAGVEQATVTESLQLAEDFVEASDDITLIGIFPKLVACLASETQNGAFGFDAGQAMHPSLLGICGSAATHAATMAQALETLGKFAGTCAPWFRLHSHTDASFLHLELELYEPCDAIAAEQIADFWTASLIAFGRLFVANTFRAASVELQRPTPTEPDRYHRYFGCHVVFEGLSNRVALELQALSQPSRLADPLLFEQLSFVADVFVRHSSANESTAQRVRESIRKGVFELSDLARELKINERTIQRRLKQEGTNFQEQLDAIRYEMANDYLKVESLTVEDIAVRLGFSGNRAFRAAYQRWSGRTPRKSRE